MVELQMMVTWQIYTYFIEDEASYNRFTLYSLNTRNLRIENAITLLSGRAPGNNVPTRFSVCFNVSPTLSCFRMSG